MKAAVISLTEGGRRLSQRIANVLGEASDRFCYAPHTDVQAQTFTSLHALVGGLFREYDALVFVCACGIAVRMCAPFLQDKRTDPAVLVLDEAGRFVIPVLSGHLGGANALSLRLADALGAQACLTTATDTRGLLSPDCFAAANHLHIGSMHACKAVASALLDGEPVGLVSRCPVQHIPAGLREGDTSCRVGICITDDPQEAPFPVTLTLTVQDIVLGIGCRRGIPQAVIEARVQDFLTRHALAPERVRAAASIDVKAQEPGLLAFCRAHALALHTYSAKALMAVPGEFSASPFVERTVGADNVCERSAVLCSEGVLLYPKEAAQGVTVAAAQCHLTIDFDRRMP